MLFVVLLRDLKEDPLELWKVISKDQAGKPNTENISYFCFLQGQAKEKEKKVSQRNCQCLPMEAVAETQIFHALFLHIYQTFFTGFHFVSPIQHKNLLAIFQHMRNSMQAIVASDVKRTGLAKPKPRNSLRTMSLGAQCRLLDHPLCANLALAAFGVSWHGNRFISHTFVYLSATCI